MAADIVLVGLPGSGKTAVGRALARHLGATYVDVDEAVERATGRSVEAVFGHEGEAGFRGRERAAIRAIAAESGTGRRVIATGGGAVADPRNRWALFLGRDVVWLDAPDAVLAARLGGDGRTRPLLAGRDAFATLRHLRTTRLRFYAAGRRIEAAGSVDEAVAAIVAGMPVAAEAVAEEAAAEEAEAAAEEAAAPEVGATAGHASDSGVLLHADLPIGRLVVGSRIAGRAIAAELQRLPAAGPRAVVVTEPGAWAATGPEVEAVLADAGRHVECVELPRGEAAKRLSAIEAAAERLAVLGVERGEPLVALGGGALTDAAGFLAATYLRGAPWLSVPTTLVGQVDAAHGGKTGVDLDAGKNLVGAFHLPAAVIVDVSFVSSLPERQRRSALAESVKAGILGDERLLEVLEADGPAIATGAPTGEPSALAEVVERSAWLKVRVVEDDPTEHGDRIALNLGHSLGHAIEAEAGFGPILHGEAVAYGLRAAARLGVRRGVTPPDRADRIEALLDELELGTEPLPSPLDAVLARLAVDKKRRGGALRWVLPSTDGWVVADDVDPAEVRDVAADVLAGRQAVATAR